MKSAFRWASFVMMMMVIRMRRELKVKAGSCGGMKPGQSEDAGITSSSALVAESQNLLAAPKTLSNLRIYLPDFRPLAEKSIAGDLIWILIPLK